MVKIQPRQKVNNQRIGKHYENIACQYLIEQGLILLAQNYQYHLGELDLVMLDKACYVFVEVRYRKNANFGDAQTTITPSKQAKIKQTAQIWMMSHNINIEDTEFRFDVFAITGKTQQWIINAF
ncbi:YraN family protein [Gilliamella sp. wkB108]|uniref:YraN family protein n=1 Tax=Gilliamella sp. wkB108 TaxID=3120256 RepID=UPI00080DCDCD|nr:YraN family protein [Gilliamella apicola]OCG26092.1 YraN family protein [Gilliamella apicola]